MYTHYIRIDEEKNIVHRFSDCYEKPDKKDIKLRETEEKKFYFEINGKKLYNPNIIHLETTEYKYKFVNDTLQVSEVMDGEL